MGEDWRQDQLQYHLYLLKFELVTVLHHYYLIKDATLLFVPNQEHLYITI